MGYGRSFLLLSAMSVVAVAAGVVASDSARAQNDPAYVVQQGDLVDQHVYNGYRRYGESCLRCHGPDGAGSSYAPSLVESLQHIDYSQFVNTIINGKQNVDQTQNKVMPAFGTTEDVVLYLDDIYGYLKARSDGKLGRGRPKRIGRDDS